MDEKRYKDLNWVHLVLALSLNCLIISVKELMINGEHMYIR